MCSAIVFRELAGSNNSSIGSGNGRRWNFLRITRTDIHAKGEDFVAFKPMTAPTSALTSGQGLRLVEPGKVFRAALRIRIRA